jgi:molybdenum cofactor guanylyltransferase
MTNSGFPVLGVLLAGGQGRRMGYVDKGLMTLGGRPLLAHAVERARPQVSTLILNAAGDPDRFAAFGLPVVADVVEGYAGPLAGVLTGLEWAAVHRPEVAWVATFATDAPFLPPDLVARLMAATGDADMASAMSAGRTHPVFGLWPVAERGALRRALIDEEIRKVDRWTARYTVAQVDFPCDPLDPFFNVNTPDDLATAERLLNAAP